MMAAMPGETLLTRENSRQLAAQVRRQLKGRLCLWISDSVDIDGEYRPEHDWLYEPLTSPDQLIRLAKWLDEELAKCGEKRSWNRKQSCGSPMRWPNYEVQRVLAVHSRRLQNSVRLRLWRDLGITDGVQYGLPWSVYGYSQFKHSKFELGVSVLDDSAVRISGRLLQTPRRFSKTFILLPDDYRPPAA